MSTIFRDDAPVRPTGRPPARPRRAAADPELFALVGCLALVSSALLPLGLVFEGDAWIRPVAGTALVSVGLTWGLRRLNSPTPLAVTVSVAAWGLFAALMFAPATLRYGVVPTGETVLTARSLLTLAGDLFMTRTAPVTAEPPLVFLAVAGVWLVSFLTAQAILYRGRALRAIVAALVLFTFPLPLAATAGRATPAAVAFFAAAALCLRLTSRIGARRWGATVPATAGGRAAGVSLAGAVVVAAVAIGAGVAFGGALPGADDPPIYQLRGRGGTTVTTNPMVAIRPSLTAQDRGPVLHVTSPRPVYLRTTALDRYDESERWTRDRILSSSIADGTLPREIEPAGPTESITVEVEVADLTGLLVPVPYPALSVSGDTADSFQYDSSVGTVTMAGGEELERGDAYTVTAALPPDADRLSSIEGYAPDSSLTDLPGNVPSDVVALARQIVDDAGATTPFRQALAIQDELRTWTYSLEPEQGHGGDEMQTFIDNRVGYCEQFAGTMAVMLRTLDIPARVAVGFGPGALTDPETGRWSVSNANAHAWVEVLFPGYGWMAFEPTPRTDGNVLVPSAATLAPPDTAARDRIAAESGTGGADDATVPEIEPDQPVPPPDAPDPPGQDDAHEGGGATGQRRPWGNPATVGIVVFGGAVGLAAGILLMRARRRTPTDARARVLHARRRADQVGTVFGVHADANETDAEYLERVGARTDQREPARSLALESARARFARTVTEESAVRAETALADLLASLPGPWTRAKGRVRGTAARALRALGRRGRYAGSSRSRLSRM
jgi:transglutaminase-like putative cysteine protease